MKVLKRKLYFILVCFILKTGFSFLQIIPLNHIEIAAFSQENNNNQFESRVVEAEANKIIINCLISNKISFSLITIQTKSFSNVQSTDFSELKYEITPITSSKTILLK